MHALKFITVFLCFLGANSQEENGFDNFLTIAMQDYPAWVISEGLDPTPIIPNSINLTINSENVDIAGEIKNQQIFNYSNYDFYQVSSDIFAGRFEIWGYLRNFRIQGEYDVNGRVFGSVPVTGSGAATLKSSSVEVDIYFENFGITEDGYVDLSVANYGYDYAYLYLYQLEGNFENLSAGGFENNVKELILKTYNSRDNLRSWLPMLQHIKEYLTPLFEKTPLSEIIGTTLRPPTTTAPTTPRTTTPPPTCPPCPSCPTATTPFSDTCPPTISCQPCPTFPTTTMSPTTTSNTFPTCPPPGESVKDPKFSRTVYESSLPAWPQRGDEINLGIRASVSDGSPLQYQLVSRYPFVQLTLTQSLNFTNDVAEGAYVGPNNVMVVEVIAEVVGDPGRQNSAAVFIVFPKTGLLNNEKDDSN